MRPGGRFAGRRTGPVALAVAAILAGAAVAGCSPEFSSPAPGHAQIALDLDAQGGCQLVIVLGGRVGGDRLRDAARQVMPSLLPRARPVSIRIEDQGGGPFARIRMAGVYTPGAEPRFTLATGSAVERLVSAGFPTVEVDVAAPRVAVTAVWTVPPDTPQEDGYWSWTEIGRGVPAPSGSLVLHPKPGTLALEPVLPALGLVCATAGGLAVRRRRLLLTRMLAGGAIVAAAVYGFVLPNGAVTDDYGVSGQLAGVPVRLVQYLPLLALAVILAGIGCLTATFIRPAAPRPLLRFNPVPGWPSPPPGWFPPPGWQPDPSWPPAPPGWQLWVEDAHPSSRSRR